VPKAAVTYVSPRLCEQLQWLGLPARAIKSCNEGLDESLDVALRIALPENCDLFRGRMISHRGKSKSRIDLSSPHTFRSSVFSVTSFVCFLSISKLQIRELISIIFAEYRSLREYSIPTEAPRTFTRNSPISCIRAKEPKMEQKQEISAITQVLKEIQGSLKEQNILMEKLLAAQNLPQIDAGMVPPSRDGDPGPSSQAQLSGQKKENTDSEAQAKEERKLAWSDKEIETLPWTYPRSGGNMEYNMEYYKCTCVITSPTE
jgi:hypothetical protein